MDDVPTDAAGVADSIVQNAIAEEHAPQSPTATWASLDSWGLIWAPLFRTTAWNPGGVCKVRTQYNPLIIPYITPI